MIFWIFGFIEANVRGFPWHWKVVDMTNILHLPPEVLIAIFGLLDCPKNLSLSCRSLKAFCRDLAVISHWLLRDPKTRIQYCPALVFEIPVLERLVWII